MYALRPNLKEGPGCNCHEFEIALNANSSPGSNQLIKVYRLLTGSLSGITATVECLEEIRNCSDFGTIRVY